MDLCESVNYNIDLIYYQQMQSSKRKCNKQIILMNISDQKQSKDGEWEGFQHFQDIAETNHTLTIQYPKDISLPPLEKQQENLYEIEPRKLICPKLKSPSRKRSDPKKELSESPLPLQKIYKNEQTLLHKNSEEKSALMELKKIQTTSEVRKYQRIPIIKFEDDYRSQGKVIYKGFVPRSSDHYFRILKEVDFDQKFERKKEIKNIHCIEFNSQFEGGNLNIAFQGSGIII